jgi:preprotein translocase subunit YajC
MLNLVMQAAPTGGAALAAQIMPLVLIGFIFYFLLIRPQNQRLKAHRALLAAITKGETVVTNGGLIGKVVKVTDDELTIDLGNAQKVKVVRSMIADVRNRAVPANDTAKKK